MGVSREHSGHSAATAQRISAAFEHYHTRRERRPRQIWRETVTCYHAAAQDCAEDFALHHIVEPATWHRVAR